MMKNAFLKDGLRQVRVTITRFLSILVITALGVAFFAGLKATGPDMRITVLEYFDRLNFMDIRLVSSIGFNGEDVNAVKDVKGVHSLMPAYSYDALALLSGKKLTVRLQSLSEEGEERNQINRPELVEGRLPQSSGECLADSRFMELSGHRIGDSVSFTSGTASPTSEALKIDTFQIVGIAKSPLYISVERGSSSVGRGKAEAFFLVPAADFNFPVYTEIYLTVEKGADISRFDDAYDEILEPVKKALEETARLRADLRYGEINEEAQKELADAKKEVEDGYRELKEGQQKLDDAKSKLEEGRMEYTLNKEAFEKKIAEGQKQLDDGYIQYNRGLAEYRKGLGDYETAKADTYARFNEAEEQLDQGRKDYEGGLAAYNEGKALHSTLVDALAGGNTPQAISILRMLIGKIEADKPELSAVLAAYAANPGNPESAVAARGAAAQFGDTLEQSRLQLDAAKQVLDKKGLELDKARLAAQEELDKAKEPLEAAKRQLDGTKETLDKKSKEIEQARSDGQGELAEAEKELVAGEAELAEAKRKFDGEKADAEKKLRDAQQEIDDGEKKLARLKLPKWYVLDHGTNVGFAGYKQDTQRIDALSLIIPPLFFLVAVLVTMTSMTRLVDSDRPYIGTLKAMGYANGRIAMRYLIYAVAASVIGSVIGLVAGFNIFPRVIFDAYSMLYNFSSIKIQFNPVYAVVSMGAAVACAALPAYFICIKSLREAPSELMRPAAPLTGKRTLMERLLFVWNRLNFSQKVAVRNLLRYKKRFIMTVIGVAGCTALMFTGFGLRDSVTTMVPKQYGNVQKYDVQIDLKQDVSPAERESLEELLESNANIVSKTEVLNKSVDVLQGTRLKSVYLVVPGAVQEFSDFVHLQDRRTQEALALGDDAVIASEKLARLLGVEEGSRIILRDDAGNEAAFTVKGVMENYIHHYIYMSPSLYKSAFGTEPIANQILCHLQDNSGENNSSFSQRLLENPAVSSVTFTEDSKTSMAKMIEALRYVVLVLILSAAALVFVVVFSLTSINLEERGRELATLKVLGFFERELAAYIYRENGVLTVLGILVGLGLGVTLQRYIITTMEVDIMMFSRELLWQSYLYSAGLTIFFTLLVNVVMLRHIRQVDMVSSLKSIE